MFRYIDNVISLYNSTFGDFVDRIYHIELEIKDTTDTYRSASYLKLHLEIAKNKFSNKRDDFNVPIVNFPFLFATCQQHVYMEYIFLSWSVISDLEACGFY